MTIQIPTIQIPTIQILKKYLRDYITKSNICFKKLLKKTYVGLIKIYKPILPFL